MTQYKYSIEVEDKPSKEGHGKIRRSIYSADGLRTKPHPEISTLYELVEFAAKRSGSDRAMGYRKLIKEHVEEKKITKKVGGQDKEVTKKWTYFEYGSYEYISYLEMQKLGQRLGAGLRSYGLKQGDKLEIFAATSMFWMLMAQAAFSQSIAIVTAYDTLGEAGLRHSIVEAQAKAIFADATLLNQLINALKDTEVKLVVYKGDAKPEHLQALKAAIEGVTVISFEELEKAGEEKPVETVPPKAEDLCCVMYTSGSTGAPKGVLLKHKNVVAALAGVDSAIQHYIGKKDYLIAFLPLAHIFELVFEFMTLWWGGCLGYASVKTLTDTNMRNCKGDLAEFRPTIMVGVPAVWEMVRKGIVAKVSQSPFIVQKMFWGAIASSKFLTACHLPGKSVLDAVIFKKIKAATGGNLRMVLSGGAPLARDTQEFLATVLCPVIVGYGLTETTATCAVQSPWLSTYYGIVGAPLSCVDIKLVDVPDAGYLSTNKPPQGEIWLRGDSITEGYLNRDEDNKEAFEDGWFKTGDIAQWEPSGLIAIIDRKKNLVKTRNGEYIAIEKLESQYRTCELAQNVCVVADQQRVKPICLVVVNEAALKKYATEKGLVGSHQDAEDMCGDDKIRHAVHERILEAGRKGGLNGIELVSAVVLLHEEFTPQNGLVTSAQKLNRKKIEETFKDGIKKAFEESE